MNTASQNLAHHLGVLRERLQHPTDYERAMHYFLEEFAGDVEFMRQSLPDDAAHLRAVLQRLTTQMLGRRVEFDQSGVLYLPEFRFFHGHAIVAGHVALFFYFEGVDTGLMTLMKNPKDSVQVARFRLAGPLAGNPRNN
jgi:hypothetical protein